MTTSRNASPAASAAGIHAHYPVDPALRASQAAWLRTAADTLELGGRVDLAADARAEAAELDIPAVPVDAPTVRCDHCHTVVRSARRIAHYGEVLGLDWVLCSKCANG